MSKGGSAPAAPDYAAAAKAQGVANLEAIRTGAALNRVNQTTPYGKVTYRQVPGATTAAPSAAPQPSGQMIDFMGMQIPSEWLNQGGSQPIGTSNTNSDQWEQITELSPEQQAILDAQEGNQIDMGRIAGQRLNQFGNQGAVDFSGQPSRITGVNQSNFRTDVSSPGTRYQDVDLNRLSGFGDANVQAGLDTSGLPAIPGADDFGAERQRVEDAVYGRATSNLDPQYQQREDAMRTRLLNSGNTEGSEAWKNEMGNFERERSGAYDQARNSAILAGGNEQSRLLGDALAARGQTFGERTTAGNFANSAAGQVNNRADSNRNQQLAELLSQGQFGNQAANQDLQAELSKLGLFNAAESDRFAQGTTNANLNNSARDAGINEQLTQRNLPLQEFLALYGGGGGAGMQAPSIPQAGTPQPEDIMGATQAGYQGRMDQYSANQARNAQNTNSLLSLAGILAMSDRSMKRDIERIGSLPIGLPTYRFRYLNGDESHIGVMADEVERLMPEAVLEIGGIKHVNYTAIGAEHLLEMH